MRLSVAVTSCHSTESERPHRVANKVENIDSRKCYFSRKYLGPHLIYDSLGPSLASFKSRLVLPFWYRLTQVVLEMRLLSGCIVGLVVGPAQLDRSNRFCGAYVMSSRHTRLRDICSNRPHLAVVSSAATRHKNARTRYWYQDHIIM